MTKRTGRLVFDSYRAAATVGRRSTTGFGRSLIFRSDRYAVDVVVHSGSDQLRLVHGQIMDERSGAPVTTADVSLGDDEMVRTDGFGQFSLSEMMVDGERVLRVQTSDEELLCAIPQGGLGG